MTPAPVQPGSATTGATTPSNQLIGTDAFLKLLVAELSHQDPLNAMDPSQMVAQLAQLSTVDELTKVRKSSQAASSPTMLQRARCHPSRATPAAIITMPIKGRYS